MFLRVHKRNEGNIMKQNMSSTIEQIISNHAQKATGHLGVYFYDLESGVSAGYHENDVFQSASVFKVFVLAELVRLEAEGKLSFSERYPLTAEVKSEGSGVLGMINEGCELTISDYTHLMMTISDNTSADFLFLKCGRDNIKKNVLDALGLTKTKCDLTCSDLISACYLQREGETLEEARARIPSRRNLAPYTGELALNDDTTPKEVAEVIRRFYTGEWVSKEAGQHALDIMMKCQTNARIPRYLPVGTPVAHKTGSMDRVANDTGIVYSPKGNYILSMFYNGNRASEEEYEANAHNYFSEELLAHISEDIYKAYITT